MPGELRDIRMIERAMRERWPIPPEFREATIKRLVRIIADPNSSNREVTSASRALMAAEAQNQQDEQQAADEFQLTILRLAQQFGVDLPGVAGTIEGTASQIPGEADGGDDDETERAG